MVRVAIALGFCVAAGWLWLLPRLPQSSGYALVWSFPCVVFLEALHRILSIHVTYVVLAVSNALVYGMVAFLVVDVIARLLGSEKGKAGKPPKEMASVWQDRTDEEVARAAQYLGDFTEEGRAILKAELKRRGIPETRAGNRRRLKHGRNWARIDSLAAIRPKLPSEPGDPPEEKSGWIAMIACPDEAAARRIADCLKDAGIDARLSDRRDVVGPDCLIAMGIDGIKVEVRQRHADEAWAIVEEASRRIEDEEQPGEETGKATDREEANRLSARPTANRARGDADPSVEAKGETNGLAPADSNAKR